MMREEKYTELITRTKASFRADQPVFAPPMSSQLRGAVRQRKKDNGLRPFLNDVMAYRIPVWQAASCVAGLFFLILFGLGREGTQPPTVYVYLTDTIYKMVPAPVIEPDWSDTVARVIPTSSLDASLHQERQTITKKDASSYLAFTAPHLSTTTHLDTGNLIAYDSSLMRPADYLINHHILHPPDLQSIEYLKDSFQQVY